MAFRSIKEISDEIKLKKLEENQKKYYITGIPELLLTSINYCSLKPYGCDKCLLNTNCPC